MTLMRLLPWGRNRSREELKPAAGEKSRSATGRSKRLLVGGAVFAALAVGTLYPPPAQAWWGWRGGWGWGWRGGWGWRPGLVVGVPPVVWAPPAYAPTPYRWVPAHYAPNGVYVPGHWAY